MRQKFAIGTVQFGLQYGVANTQGKVSMAEIRGILSVGRQLGVDTLDTAIAYGDSESCLGEAGVAAWQVVTKLPPLPVNLADIGAWVDSQIRISLQRLRLPSLSAVLLHRSTDIIGPHALAYQSALHQLKQDGLCQAVGVSIYAPGDLDAIWAHPGGWRPDLVQAPFNVLDRRLITSGWMQRLHQAGVRLHTRSAFLQGLLLMPSQKRPAWFVPWAGVLDAWHAWCAAQQISPLQAALQFACSYSEVERIVLGFDTALQLQEVAACAKFPAVAVPAEFSSGDVNLIDPSRWKLA
jgi:aryl-alcohol dehydrogenase-like predicted oxidoreductase